MSEDMEAARALSRLFRRMWDGEAGRVPKETIEVMKTLGLIDIAPNGFVSLTSLGRAALAPEEAP